jgi:hypothetical protein
MVAPVAAQQVDDVSLLAVDAGANPVRVGKKMAAPMAAPKAGEASPAAVDAGSYLVETGEKMAVPVATQKDGEASPVAVYAGGVCAILIQLYTSTEHLKRVYTSPGVNFGNILFR